MGIYDDWEFASPVRTVVLVGRTGNGKSATCNSILRRSSFKSMSSSAGVTSTCELQRTVLEDGLILNVIDTPGLFDFSAEPEFIGKEIVNCINMAKDGIHAVLVVLSVRSRFSREEEAAIESLREFFGSKIGDYMILVFTGGDDLEENDESLDDYLGRDCPEPLKETLRMCGNRCVLFDNRTKDESKKAEQLMELLSFVNAVVDNNGGKPYTDDLFFELKAGALKLRDQTAVTLYIELGFAFVDNVICRLSRSSGRLLIMADRKEEQAARLKAESMAQAAQKESDDEIRKLREHLERAHRENEEFRKQAESGKCVIL
ncbi:UNVERIFIED_CONTAM: Immune-associated nucleotide-binding protein 9 [Sesamum calycinum]|uniref:Immune-associated nucleotide-binding protein 9 n=1 Tax=Sesamum calycinum TaxID=2727403 RepID=A0AAW2P8C8_9LAMI